MLKSMGSTSILCIIAMLISLTPAIGDPFPTKAVTIVVPFAAGGPTDATARLVARGLEELTRQPFVIENVGGAGSTIGASRVAAASPDGYTLLMATSSALAIAPHLFPKLNYDVFKSFTPIGMINTAPFVLLVNASSPYKTFDSFVAYGRDHPGKLNYATPGFGTTQHLTFELMLRDINVAAVPVPYKGGAPAMTALLAGEVDCLIENPSSAMPQIAGRKIRAIAVTSKARLAELPDVPTLSESGLEGFESLAWFAIMAPAGVPEPVLAVLRKTLAETLRDERTTAAMRAAGIEPSPMGSSELQIFTKREFDKYGELIRQRQITLDEVVK